MTEEDPWVAYKDLEKHGFVNPDTKRPFSRKHLIDMQRGGLWPKATQISPNRVAWRLSELQRHDTSRPVARSVRDGAGADGPAAA